MMPRRYLNTGKPYGSMHIQRSAYSAYVKKADKSR